MHEKEMNQQLIEETSKENIIVRKLWTILTNMKFQLKKWASWRW